MISKYTRKKRMKKIFTSVAFFAIIAYVAIVLLDKVPVSNEVVAKINGKKIYKSEILARISQIFMVPEGSNIEDLIQIENLPPEAIETFVKEIYLEKKLVRKAKQAKIHKDEKIKQELEQVEARILIDAYLNYIIEENVSEEKIKEKYAEISANAQGKKEYEIAHILVEDEKTANMLYRAYNETSLAKKPAKFADLAKRYSIDKETAGKKGEIGYVLEDEIEKNLTKDIIKMKRGEYTKPFKTENGWEIVLVQNVRDAKMADFEDSKDEIRAQMIKQETKKIYEDIFKDVKIKVLIESKVIEPQVQKNSEENEAKK